MDILDQIAQARRDAADYRSSRLHSLIRRKSRRLIRRLFLILVVISLGAAAFYYKDGVVPIFWRVHAEVSRKIAATHWTGSPTGSDRPSFFSADEMTPTELFARASPAVVTVHVSGPDIEAWGSGFFVSDDGLLVTNYHVIADTDAAAVVFADGTRANVLGIAAASEKWDIAILRVEYRPNVFLKLKREEPAVGTRVFAIGSPQKLANSLSEGLVSGIRDDGIQVTAPISHGSSGGPLLDAHGEVLGVTTFYINGGENLNFAVPSARVIDLMASIAPTRPLPAAAARVEAQRQADVVQHLRELAAASAKDKYGFTPLHIAARAGDIAKVQYLLDLGVDPDARSDLQQTALHLAAWHGQAEIARLLIAHGADVNARMQDGRTPLNFAQSYGNADVISVLEGNGGRD